MNQTHIQSALTIKSLKLTMNNPANLAKNLTKACTLIETAVLTPGDYLAECNRLADAVEPTLKAFLVRDTVDGMLQKMRSGPLRGIPVAVKDIIATQDLPTTNGSLIYQNHMPAADAPIIQKIRSLGGVVFGKTVTTEFAWRHPGPTTNPWNSEHTPGGSSSGSAASVAAGIVPLALGSQTQGSIVRPAAFCGVVGYKASYGAVSKVGVHPLSGSLDHIGFFTRSVDDAAYALLLLKNDDVTEAGSIVLPDFALDSQHAIAPQHPHPKIAVLQTPFDHLISAEQQAALRSSVEKLRTAGAIVEALTIPDAYWDAIQDMNLIMDCEAAVIHQDHLQNHSELVSNHIKELAERGVKYSASAYIHALHKQQRMRKSIGTFFAQYDAFLSVPASGEAPKGLTSTGDPIFCALWSFLGVPAMTLPLTKSSNGLPLGIQLIGNYREDALLLAVAKFAEAAFLD
jgi:Asp-tRNA(Asn)/Glu-tRNA(Gln) amidotransferase A subunit family amidase